MKQIISLFITCFAITATDAQSLASFAATDGRKANVISKPLTNPVHLVTRKLDRMSEVDLTGILLTDSSVTFTGEGEGENVETIVHPTVTIGSKIYHIVEGDLLLDENQYFRYRVSMLARNRDTSRKLVVETVRGRVLKWESGAILNYAVIHNSFDSEAEYEEVKTNFLQATRDWEQTCNIKFRHLEAYDSQNLMEPAGELTFVVVAADVQGFIAEAFFPNDSTSERRVIVTPSYYTTTVNHIGVLRHEIGHILGFRHEQVRPESPADCRYVRNEQGQLVQIEPMANGVPLTDYDRNSVMHYLCAGAGTRELKITALDRKGAQEVYGPPPATASDH